ncbi:MAG: SDR family oxidoreductase [Burkholderiales bacterium]|nr:SDR family oxidoreductase [Burkholderiales bacterium]
MPHPDASPAAAQPGRVAVVTGGAGGLGLAIARRMARAGVSSALWDIDGAKATAAAATIPSARGYRVDVTDYDAVVAATRKVVDDFGRIDILINGAGINGPIAPLLDYPLDGWRRTMALNLDAVFHCCRAVVPEMLKQDWGRVVNLSSIGGKEGNPNASCYAASKAGVIGMTKAFGKELAKTGVRVNAVAPAAIETDMLAQLTPEFRAGVIAKIPLGRLGRPEEVADLVNWLASEECSFSTGAVFDVSGGRATY